MANESELRLVIAEGAARHPVGDDFAQAAIDAIPPPDDGLEVCGRQCDQVREQRRAVEHVDNRVHEGHDQRSDFLVGRLIVLGDFVQQIDQSIERVLVAGEQNFFLVAEVNSTDCRFSIRSDAAIR